ncbi:MAG: helix-turn-helix transcriptional regulator [Ruminococcus sp.]|nr:helix-turn-helix transcriptional regulator [Ruminococcus sp.]
MKHYKRIRDLREDNDLTQETLCKKLYVNKSTYTYYEQGKHTIPLDFAVLLADFYQVSLDYIAGRTETKHFESQLHLNSDEKNIIQQYRILTERNKGRVEQLVDMLLENQKK